MDDPLVGKKVGPYRIERLLGRGGMGAVYRAEDSTLGRRVALKVLLTEVAESPARRKRFLREARAVAHLSHPNVASAYGAGEDEGRLWFAMELVEGETLSERIRCGDLDDRRSVEIALGIARGVAQAHAVGIVHRDLKPGNVMLTPTGVPKVLDFGLAKGDGASPGETNVDETELQTRVGSMVGTPGYMSPEQTRGEADVDHRTDVFALGVILYQTTCGRLPFGGKTPIDRAAAVLHFEPLAPSSIRGDYSLELEKVVLRCLAKDAEERFAETGELVARLEALLETDSLHGRVGVAPDVPRGPRVVTEILESAPRPAVDAPADEGETRSASRAPRLITATVLLTLLLAGALFYASRGRLDPIGETDAPVTDADTGGTSRGSAGDGEPASGESPVALAELSLTRLTETPSDNVIRAIAVSRGRLVALDTSGLWEWPIDSSGEEEGRRALPFEEGVVARDLWGLPGGRILVEGSDADGVGGHWVVGETTQRVRTAELYGGWPSPDGSQVAFVAGGALRVAELTAPRSRSVATLSAAEMVTALAWKPDGSALALIRAAASDELARLEIVGTDGSQTRTLLVEPRLSLPAGRGALAWLNGRLFYAMTDESGDSMELWARAPEQDAVPTRVRALEGSAITHLFASASDLVFLRWNLQRDVYVGTLADRRLRDVTAWTTHHRDDWPSSWSGNALLFSSDRDGAWDVYALDRPRVDPRRLLGGPALQTWPLALSDALLSFELSPTREGEESSYRVMRSGLDGAGARAILTAQAPTRGATAGVPPPLEASFRCADSRCVLYERGEGLLAFTRFDPETGARAEVLQHPAAVMRDWALSPRGGTLALVDGSAEFTLLEFDGTARRIAVTSDARLAHVAFEPDGRAVILAGEGVDGPVLLRSDLSGQASLLYSSLEGAFERPVVGGPGGRLAFAARTDESDVWRLSGLR